MRVNSSPDKSVYDMSPAVVEQWRKARDYFSGKATKPEGVLAWGGKAVGKSVFALAHGMLMTSALKKGTKVEDK